MTKTYCNKCEKEITSKNEMKNEITIYVNEKNKTASRSRIIYKDPILKMRLVSHGVNGFFDICKHCTIDAINETDDRKVNFQVLRPEITEGMTSKGGVNTKPTTPKPQAPKGKEVIHNKDLTID